jgi:7-carboxy-7-deazaguanine synthase
MDAPLQVCETFVSIQGESTWAGAPCFFIRLAGCNLHCSYCDTEYARSGGAPKTIAALAAEFRAAGVGLAEVTGGEPLIQAGVADLLARLKEFGTVLVETNGSRNISTIPAGVIAILDLKCPSSGESAAMDWKNLERLRPADEVKFVIGNRADYEWARQIIFEHNLAARCHAVLLGPVFNALAPAELAAWILKDRLPVRLGLQLHKTIWPPEARGV